MEGNADLARLHALQDFLSGASLEDSLQGQARECARMLHADSCSIMLLGGGERQGKGSGKDERLRVHAHAGAPGDRLPAAALEASIGRGEAICGQVLASGQALLVEDIGKSAYALLARRPEDPGRSMMSAPIRIEGRTVGVANVAGTGFTRADLALFEVICLFMGKSIQVAQLQHLLASRFAQQALAQEADGVAPGSYRNPEDVARILARSFYKELVRGGFEATQIVGAASEIIDQLNNKLQKKH